MKRDNSSTARGGGLAQFASCCPQNRHHRNFRHGKRVSVMQVRYAFPGDWYAWSDSDTAGFELPIPWGGFRTTDCYCVEPQHVFTFRSKCYELGTIRASRSCENEPAPEFEK